MISFVMVERTVRFEVNTTAMATAGLRADSRLLAVARRSKRNQSK